MSEADIQRAGGPAIVFHYLIAVAAVATALIATLLLQPNALKSPLFLLAIILSAWFGGLGPGLFSALLSTLCLDYYFLPPFRSFKFDVTQFPQLLVFFISAVLVSSWSVVRRRAETLLRKARDEQEAKVVIVASRWSLQRDDSGEPVAILETNNNVSEQKHAQEVLLQTQAELAHIARVTTMGELTSSIAHEVNQPLAAIVMSGNACLRWLSGNPPNIEEARQSITRMVRDGHRASEVVQRVRTFFKKTTPQSTKLDLNDLIEDVILILDGELRRNRVRVRTELNGDLPQVICDRIQLQQVLVNLIINANEAMSAVAGARELVIKSQKSPGCVQITVQDNGPGLDAQDIAKLFNAFYTTKPNGLGMGLSISRTAIEAYGGRLWAINSERGGATFQFTLPTTDAND